MRNRGWKRVAYTQHLEEEEDEEKEERRDKTDLWFGCVERLDDDGA